MLKHWLTSLKPSLKIHEADNSQEALEILKTLDHSSLYMIVDYNMPGMTGLEFIDHGKVSVSTDRIALCTANIQASIRSRAEESGVIYLAKPVNPAKVEQLLKDFNI